MERLEKVDTDKKIPPVFKLGVLTVYYRFLRRRVSVYFRASSTNSSALLYPGTDSKPERILAAITIRSSWEEERRLLYSVWLPSDSFNFSRRNFSASFSIELEAFVFLGGEVFLLVVTAALFYYYFVIV